MLKLKNLPSLVLSIVFILVLISCEEKLSSFGDGILPSSDGLEIFSDTLRDIQMVTVVSEEVNTTDNAFPLVGCLNNSFTGKVSSTLITQFLPQYPIGSYNDNIAEFTGATLTLVIDTPIVGDKYASIVMRVSQLFPGTSPNDLGMYDGEDYYSNQDYSELFPEQKLVFEESFTIAEKVKHDSSGNYFYMDFELPESFYDSLYQKQERLLADKRFYNDTVYISSTGDTIDYKDYDSDTILYNHNKSLGALAISFSLPDGSEGAMIGINIKKNTGSSSYPFYKTGIHVNYLYSNSISSSFDYAFNTSYAHLSNYTQITNDRNGYPINDIIDNANDSIGMVQSMVGFKTKIIVPGLKDLIQVDEDIVINKAELTINQNRTDLFKYQPIKRLWCTDQENSYDQISEDINRSVNFGGVYNETLFQYKLEIPHIVQSLIMNDGNEELFLFPVDLKSSVLYPGTASYSGTVIDASSLELILTYIKP